MEELLKEKEELEKQLAKINKKIDEEQHKEELISEIKNKAHTLELLLSNTFPIRVDYFEQINELLIIEDYDSEHETTLYHNTFDNLHKTLETLNTAIDNYKIINNKLRIKEKKPLLDNYKYSFDDLIHNNTMIIRSSDEFHTSFSKPFKVILDAEVHVSDKDTIDLEIKTIVSYNHNIEKKYSKKVENIDFDIKYTDHSDYTLRSEEFSCRINNLKIYELYNTLQKVKSLSLSNSDLVQLSKVND